MKRGQRTYLYEEKPVFYWDDDAEDIYENSFHANVGTEEIKEGDDPIDKTQVIQDRKKYKNFTLYNLTKALGEQYDLKKLQDLFFGDVLPDPEGWRNNIIRHYLLNEGWEAGDPVPQWVEYKFIYNEDGSEVLVMYTPLPGMLGKEAAFGFMRWDLGYGTAKKFYRYQGNRTNYDNATDLSTLENDRADGLNTKSGTTTKEEIIYEPGYAKLEPTTAITLAYELVKTFEKNLYIQDPQHKGSFLDHHAYVSLEDLLVTEPRTSANNYGHAGETAGRRDYFSKDFMGKGHQTKKGTQETIFQSVGTTLGIAQKFYIQQGNAKFKGSALAEESLGANNLIQHFDHFKEGVGKAVFFINFYGSFGEAGKSKAQKAINNYKSTIVKAYVLPEQLVNFSVADTLLDEAYAALNKDIYGSDGHYTQSLNFAKEAIKSLRKDKHLANYSDMFSYIDKLLAARAPGSVNLNAAEHEKINLKPLAGVELALGIIDVMSQVSMLYAVIDSIREIDGYAQHCNEYVWKFMEILMDISMAIGSQDENKMRQRITDGRNLITEEYAEKIKIDIFLAETDAKMAQIQLEFVLIGATIVSAYAGGVLGQIIGRLVGGALSGTALSTTSIAFIAGFAEVGTAAFTTTVLSQLFESALTGKEFGEGFGKEFLINFMLFGAFKLLEVAVIGKNIPKRPPTAKPLGEGVWKDISSGRPVYYVDKQYASILEMKAGGKNVGMPNQLARYPQIRSTFAEVQNTLKSQGHDSHLIENALKRSNKTTLEFFEKNPNKLLQASEKIAKQQLKAVEGLNPLAKTVETSTMLDKMMIYYQELEVIRVEMEIELNEWVKLQRELAPSKTQKGSFNTATIVRDKITGKYYFGSNKGVFAKGGTLETLEKDLQMRLPKESTNSYRLGNCAECDAVNQALKDNAKWGDLQMYTLQVDPVSGKTFFKPLCTNCEFTFKGVEGVEVLEILK